MEPLPNSAAVVKSSIGWYTPIGSLRRCLRAVLATPTATRFQSTGSVVTTPEYRDAGRSATGGGRGYHGGTPTPLTPRTARPGRSLSTHQIDPDTLLSINNLADLYHTQARYERAATLFAQAVAGAREAWPARHWATGVILGGYGETLTALQRYEEAETALLEAYELIFAGLGPDHEYTIGVVEFIADLYTAWHEAEPDKGHDAKAAEWRAKLPDEVNSNEQDY